MTIWHLLVCSIVLTCPTPSNAQTNQPVTKKLSSVEGHQVTMILKTLNVPRKGILITSERQKGERVLMADGQEIMVAPRIEQAYSISTNGVIAVIAYSSENVPLHLADVDKFGLLQGSTGTLWIKRSNETASNIRLQELHVTHALISPDGKYVAFTARSIRPKGILGKEVVYLSQVDSPSEAPIIIVETVTQSGAARPIRWNSNEELQVFVSTDEDGSKTRIDSFSIIKK